MFHRSKRQETQTEYVGRHRAPDGPEPKHLAEDLFVTDELPTLSQHSYGVDGFGKER